MIGTLIVERLTPLVLTVADIRMIDGIECEFGAAINYAERGQFCRRVHNNNDVACAQYVINSDFVQDEDDERNLSKAMLVEFWRDDQNPKVIHYAWM